MSKNHKKRRKPYRGADAATGPRVTHYSVGQENSLAAWWKAHRRVTLFRLALVVLALLISWLLYSLIY